jgi:flagellar biosynthesis protein FlhF
MKIKKFVAADTQSALELVKKEFGPDAVVLHVGERKDRKSGQAVVEVTAAVDEERTEPVAAFLSAISSAAAKPDFGRRARQEYAAGQRGGGQPEGRHRNLSINGEGSSATWKELEEVRAQLKAMTELLRQNGHPDLEPHLLEPYARLLSRGISKETALRLLKGVPNQNGSTLKKTLEQEVARYLRELWQTRRRSLDQSPEVHVMVGPTGVGKTTCIAKLSAQDKVLHGRKVGIITLDTYRLAAAEQLRTFTNISKIPLQVVYSPDELVEAVESFRDYERIYIDTPGRSPYDEASLSDLKRYLIRIPRSQVHLVLSLNSHPEDLLASIERFSLFSPDRLLFTKLDETVRSGMLLDIVYRTRRPVSYVANGQSIPDDIVEADPNWIAKTILGGVL